MDSGPVRLMTIAHAFNYRVAVLRDGVRSAVRVGRSQKAATCFLKDVNITWEQQVTAMFQIVLTLMEEVPAFALQMRELQGESPNIQLKDNPWGHVEHCDANCACLESDRTGAYVHYLLPLPGTLDSTPQESKGKFQSVLVITDVFTKYAWAIPTRNQTAVTTARALFDQFLVHYGFPQKLHSDQGPQFEGRLIHELCKLTGTTKSRTTPYHPMGNAVTERFNRTLINMLRTVSAERKADWKSCISSLVHAYNSTLHDSTGHSPFYLMFGRQPRLPIDVLFNLGASEAASDYTDFVKKLEQHLKLAYRVASNNSDRSVRGNKRRYDRKVLGAVPKVGDRVLLKNIGLKGKHKLANKWQSDVFLVVGQNDLELPVYQIQKESGQGKIRTVHRNLLLPLALPLDAKLVGHTRPTPRDVDDPTYADVPVIQSDSDEEVHVMYPTENDQQDLAESIHSTTSDEESEASESDDSNIDESAAPRRSGRNRRPPAWLRSGDYVTMGQRASSTDHSNCHHHLKLVTRVYLSMIKCQADMLRDLMSHMSH